MSEKQRLPWFPCYPQKLLVALSSMPPDVALVYLITLLRIYEDGGSVAENINTLSRRTGLSRMRCGRALEQLIEDGRLVVQDDKLINPVAEQHLREQNKIHSERTQKAKAAAQKRWQKPQHNQQNGNHVALPKQVDLEVDKELKVGRAKRTRTIGTRMPKDWKLTAERMAYGISRGLKPQEVTRSAEKFVEYWPQQSDQKGVKADWDATWRGWCIREGERLEREPVNNSGPRELTADEWRSVLRVFESTSNWPGPGAPPGKPGCIVPAELLQGRLV